MFSQTPYMGSTYTPISFIKYQSHLIKTKLTYLSASSMEGVQETLGIGKNFAMLLQDEC